MKLKGSKTEKNLKAAFTGESMARNKYTYFAEAAKEDVCDILIKQGFDFQGKSPGRAVHLTWVNMGYAKKQIQQGFIQSKLKGGLIQ